MLAWERLPEDIHRSTNVKSQRRPAGNIMVTHSHVPFIEYLAEKVLLSIEKFEIVETETA
jgi:hypothetical protein